VTGDDDKRRGRGVDWTGVRMPGIDGTTVAVVLGAGGAIGSQTCRALTALGTTIVPVTRVASQGEELADELAAGDRVVPMTADLADSDSLRSVVAELSERRLIPSVLINSAAVGVSRADLLDVSREQFSRLYDVNVVGAFEAIKAVAGMMRSAGRGKVVNVASVAAQRVLVGSSAYGSSKAALISLSQHLAVDLGLYGITVNSVSPGQTPTRLRGWDESAGRPPEPTPPSATADGIPLRRRGALDDYVGAILFLCSSLADYITGVDIPVEGGARLVRAKSY
jgi:NAD(P)-dependent dehydrogenase (short-subunit alcohol dehydrogenase family)